MTNMTTARIPRIWRAISLTITISFLSFPVYAKYSGGTGELNDPYQIATAEDLIALGETPEDYDKHFILTTDIDLAGQVFDRAVIAPDVNNADWRFNGTRFTGVFDGKGHTISHLTVTGGDYLGLFGRLYYGSNVSNLGLEEVDVGGTGGNIGSLAGQNNGSITSSYSTGSVSGDHDVGGLVGDNNNGNIIQCYSAGVVSGVSIVGGLVGNNAGSYGGYINQCYSTCVVSGDENVSGLVDLRPFRRGQDHYSRGTVIDSFWDIQTSGQATSNGGTGKTTAEMKTYRTFLRWGTCGDGGTWTIDEGNDYPRLAWERRPGIVLDFRLSDFLEGSGTEDDPYLIYTSDDIETIAFFPCEEDKCFRLAFLEGRGTQDNPYQLATAEQLNMIGLLSWEWDKHYKLVDDINLSAFDGRDGRPAFKQIGTFTGVFDGDGHTISHLTATGYYHGGLFGMLESGAEVRNLAVMDVSIVSSGDDVGGLVGSNGSLDTPGGTVIQCSVTGTIKGGRHVGGLVGYNGGSIVQSYSSGSVDGREQVGGLVGGNYEGNVATSYSTSSVNGNSLVGGLVGYNYEGTVIHCYSAGSVSGDEKFGGLVGSGSPASVLQCVWDIEISGQSGSVGGVGLTTAEMMDPYMLGLNGFANESNWILDADRDYPRLVWEGTMGQVIPEPEINWLTGRGRSEDPYEIETADQLIMLGKASILWDKDFILGADIDLGPYLPGGHIFGQAVIPAFSGVFDGKNHKIIHMTITGESYLGLFGQLHSKANVLNLGLEAVDVNGTGGWVGGLAGYDYGSNIAASYIDGAVNGYWSVGGLVGYNEHGSITTSYSTISANGDYSVGGLVGINNGRIATCYSTDTVTGLGNVGGLVGINHYSGSITTSYSMSSAIASERVGGLVGYNSRGNIAASFSTGAVSGDSSVGGLVGCQERGTITTSCSAGTVTGQVGVGGLVGWNSGDIGTSYSRGTVSGNNSVGGLVGDNMRTITHCYSTGSVNGLEGDIGGLVGSCSQYATVTSSFWNIQTSDLATSDGGTGKTTAEMQTAKTFLDAGWDFVDETANGTEDIWWILEGKDYPRLWWEAIPEN